jgi:hypothetical protein
VSGVNASGRGRVVVLVVGALGQLAVWLVLRPDLAGPQWTDGSVLEIWLVSEALAAVLIGLLAPDRSTVARTILLGWLLQGLHLIVLGEHYDNTLWGFGVFIDVILAASAVGLALLARRLTGRDRRPVLS